MRVSRATSGTSGTTTMGLTGQPHGDSRAMPAVLGFRVASTRSATRSGRPRDGSGKTRSAPIRIRLAQLVDAVLSRGLEGVICLDSPAALLVVGEIAALISDRDIAGDRLRWRRRVAIAHHDAQALKAGMIGDARAADRNVALPSTRARCSAPQILAMIRPRAQSSALPTAVTPGSPWIKSVG